MLIFLPPRLPFRPETGLPSSADIPQELPTALLAAH